MVVHPIEYRYGRKQVKDIFDKKSKLNRLLEVEAALARAHAKVGNIPEQAGREISKKANTEYVKQERVDEIEAEINHDIMAVVKALTEQCEGEAGKYIHLGATSNDILDTSLALQLKEFLPYLKQDLENLRDELLEKASEHKETVCIGRTHGQHAIPTTYGLKFAIFAEEFQRHLDRLEECEKRLLVGQLTGAVGTQASLGEKGIEIQEHMMSELGLKPVLVSNQVIQRDRHGEFLNLLSLIASSLDKLATEIRNLQRTELNEVSEGFGKNQVGSSTMPHKRNPIKAERICGLSRVIKSNAQAGLENIPLWHERDLTNSSCERIIIPEASILVDYILNLSMKLVKNLVFNQKEIQKNLEMTQGRVMAEALMIRLVEKGVGRQKAHEMVRKAAMESFHSKVQFRETLLENTEIRKHLNEEEIDSALDPKNYLGTAVKQVEKVVRRER